MSLWVPPKVSRELRERTREHTAEVLKTVDASRALATCRRFNSDLRRIDPNLSLIFAPPNATAAGLRPGFYHLLKEVPGDPPSLLPITGEHGEFVEPTSQVFDKLAEGDLWNATARHERSRREREATLAAERQRAREREDRHEELKDRVKAARETSISMNTDSPWSQNMDGRRGRSVSRG